MGSTRIVVSIDDSWQPEEDESGAYDIIRASLEYDKIPATVTEQDAKQTALERAAPALLECLDWIVGCPTIKGPAGTTAYVISAAMMKRAKHAINLTRKAGA